MTIADLAFVATYSAIKVSEVAALDSFPELNTWFEKLIKEIPNYEKANGEGALEFGQYYKNKLAETTKA